MSEERELHPPTIVFELEDTLRIVFTEHEDDINGRTTMMHVELSDDTDALGNPVWQSVEDDAAALLAMELVDALDARPDWAEEEEDDDE